MTPGPWHVAYLDKHGQHVVKGEHIEIATCWHHSVGAIEQEMEANARLIAAAPDLLAALQRLAAIVHSDAWFLAYAREEHAAAVAAIAAATGDAP